LTGADDVGTATALDTVGAFTAFPAFTDDVDGVVATESVHMVVARTRVDGVSVIGADDRVAAGCALDGLGERCTTEDEH
jgi:hypothetical protein